MPYLSFLFICLVWGASFILMDRASHALGPVSIAVCRLLGGALVLAIYWISNRQPVRIRWVDWGHIGVGGRPGERPALRDSTLCDDSSRRTCLFRHDGCAGTAGNDPGLDADAQALANAPAVDRRAGRHSLHGAGGARRFGTGHLARLLALALTVPLSYAVGNAYVKWKLDHLPALPITTLFLGPRRNSCSCRSRSRRKLLADWNLANPQQPYDWPLAIASIVFLSAVGTGIAILLFVQLIKNQGPLFAGMVTYVVPVLALFWGQYDKERLTATQLVGHRRRVGDGRPGPVGRRDAHPCPAAGRNLARVLIGALGSRPALPGDVAVHPWDLRHYIPRASNELTAVWPR